MSNGRDTADNIELAIDAFAFAAFGAMQQISADNRLRREIHRHNAAVAAIRAQRARRRAQQEALGAELMAGWLRDREQLH